MWCHFKSPVGIFWIGPHARQRERWELGIDKKSLGLYLDPEQAAHEVNMHVTGHADWDGMDGETESPKDLDGWTPGRPPL